MKLNNREKAILGIVLAIAFLLIALLGFVRPRVAKIKADKVVRTQKEEEKAEVDRKIDMIPTLTKKINETYEETKKLSDDFVEINSIANTYDLDQLLQNYAEENEVKIIDLNAGVVKDEKLEYYYLESKELAKDFFASADLNGGYTDMRDKQLAEELALKDRNEETVMGAKYGVKVRGKKENIWKYMQAIADQDETIIINSVDIADYTFQGQVDEKERVTPNENGESEVSFVLTLYSVYEMEKPNTEMK